MVNAFISYLDEDGNKVEGYFELVNANSDGYAVFNTKENQLKIPLYRILKIKVKL